jgi:enoyl-CoA hydratase
MTTTGVSTHRQGPVAIVTIDRPARRNAVDGPTAAALEAAVVAVDGDPDVGAIVVTGAGGTFCAGADLRALGTPDGNRLAADGPGPMGPTRLVTTTPTIAAVEGHAVAGGLELALWCDLRVVAEGAVFGVFCRRWGVPLIDGGTARLPRVVGSGVALDLVLTGREVHADEALRIGLATRVVPRGTALEAAVALGRELAAFPRACLEADLASTRAAFDRALPEALVAEHVAGVASIDRDTGNGDMAANVARFVAGAGRHGLAAPPDTAS